jgi:hypothetical protein
MDSKSVVIGILAAAYASGCSLATRGPSSSAPRDREPDCTKSMALPVIDTIAAVALAAAAISIFGNDPCQTPDGPASRNRRQPYGAAQGSASPGPSTRIAGLRLETVQEQWMIAQWPRDRVMEQRATDGALIAA